MNEIALCVHLNRPCLSSFLLSSRQDCRVPLQGTRNDVVLSTYNHSLL
jgi:hypothetical protein